MSDMHLYVVGKPYNPSRRQWEERYVYQYRQGGHELLIFLKSPTKEEVKAVESGTPEFALFVQQPTIWFLSRFAPGLTWSDTPYSWHLVLGDEKQIPQEFEREGQRMLLSVLLIDADTGILRAMRAVSLSPDFSRALHAAIQTQIETGYPGDDAFGRNITRVYGRYPDTGLMLKDAIARCEGGKQED